jgi:excisionase family DNA binding protein
MGAGHLLTPTEVADRLGIKERTVGEWRRRGDGPDYLIVGNKARYRPADLDAWVAAQVVQAETAK